MVQSLIEEEKQKKVELSKVQADLPTQILDLKKYIDLVQKPDKIVE